MKKVILTCCMSLCFIFVLSLSACKKEVKESENEEVMPLIVFGFWEHNCVKEHEDNLWFIDNQGKVYHTYELKSVPNLLEEYTSESNEKSYWKVGQIDMELLKQKYSIVQQIIKGGNYEVKEREEGLEITDVYAGDKDWIARGYNQGGEEIGIHLYREYEDYCGYNNDSRATELAVWIIEIISQYDEYDPVEYLNNGIIPEE